MKKIYIIVLLAFMATQHAQAQNEDHPWAFNTRAWSTNYFTTLIWDVGTTLLKHLAFHDNEDGLLWANRIVPLTDVMAPIGMAKEGFHDYNNIYGPYHRSFSNPFKHIGDWGVGADVFFMPSVVGIYTGVYFKSQEIVFKETNSNLRGFYLQPRIGLMAGNDDIHIGAGVHYDAVTGCKGNLPILPAPGSEGRVETGPEVTDKDILLSGLGLDFSLSFGERDNGQRTVIEFSMPLHNFLNPDHDFPTSVTLEKGMKRKIGYIMVTQRLAL